jgi:hypothetical protein
VVGNWSIAAEWISDKASTAHTVSEMAMLLVNAPQPPRRPKPPPKHPHQRLRLLLSQLLHPLSSSSSLGYPCYTSISQSSGS